MTAVGPMSVPSSFCYENERNVVRERHGSVLSRGLVLKVDQRPNRTSLC